MCALNSLFFSEIENSFFLEFEDNEQLLHRLFMEKGENRVFYKRFFQKVGNRINPHLHLSGFTFFSNGDEAGCFLSLMNANARTFS